MLQMIFESPDNRYPTVEELVLCDLFRNIDLREMRGPSISVSVHSLEETTIIIVIIDVIECNNLYAMEFDGFFSYDCAISQSFKHGLSMSTLNLLNAVRRRQGASLNGSYSEGSSPCTPPSTPRRIG